jgi:hypothetical protein
MTSKVERLQYSECKQILHRKIRISIVEWKVCLRESDLVSSFTYARQREQNRAAFHPQINLPGIPGFYSPEKKELF